MEKCVCPGQESNLHDLKRSLGPQPSASTNSATWAGDIQKFASQNAGANIVKIIMVVIQCIKEVPQPGERITLRAMISRITAVDLCSLSH